MYLFKRPLQFLMISATILSGCSSETRKDKEKAPQAEIDGINQSGMVKEPILNADTLVIDKKAAVFYQPDTIQIEIRKKEIGEDKFMIGADDYLYSMHIAYNFIDSARLTMLDAKGKRFLKFVTADKSQQIIKLDTLPELWGLFLFDPIKKPKLVDMTIIDEEYKSYFK